MTIHPIRPAGLVSGTEDNSASPRGARAAQVRLPAADGLPGRPTAPLERSSSLPRNFKWSHKAAHADLRGSVAAIGTQLGWLADPIKMPDGTPASANAALQPLRALQSLCTPLGDAQRQEVQAQLRAAILALDQPEISRALLNEVVADLSRAAGPPPLQCLAGKTFERLCMPRLKMKEAHEDQPATRTFNSILPVLVAGADDHGTLGRTLLWLGARHLFDGPRQEERSLALKTAMFDLKIDEKDLKAAAAELGLPIEQKDLCFEQVADEKLDELKLYEQENKTPH